MKADNKKHNNFYAALDMLRNYRYKSVFFQYWRLIIMGLAAVLLLVIFLVSSYKSTQYYNNISSMLSKNMYNSRNALDSLFADILQNEQKLMTQFDGLPPNGGDALSVKNISAVEDFLADTVDGSDVIKSVYLYFPGSDYVVSSSKIYKSSARADFADISWYDTYYGGTSSVFLRSHPQNAVFKNCITVCLNSENTVFGETLVVFNIKYDKVNFTKNMGMFNDYEISVVNGDGMILYSTNIDRVAHNTAEFKELNRMVCMSDNDVNNVKTYQTRRALLESVQTRNIKTTLICSVSKKELRTMNGGFGSMINTIAAVSIVLLAVSVFITVKFYSVIADLLYKVNKKEKSTESAPKTASNEIDEIDTQISDIIENKSRTESKLADSIMELQRSQSIALQSQFSPHFLFNTLQLINSIAFVEIGRDNHITDAVGILCDILHAAMDTTEYTCLLKDELELAKKYVKLQNMKYEDAFNVSYDIDEQVLPHKVAKLSLQPVLENSMHHGFGYGRDILNITIHAHLVNDKLIVSVEDDGIGMTEEREKEVAENLENKQIEKKNSIGLLNLNQRIKLIFGYEYGCTISNNPGDGVTVTMAYPIR